MLCVDINQSFDAPRIGGCATRKRPGEEVPGLRFRLKVALIIHTAHATARHSRCPTVFLRPFGDHGFRRDQKPGDRRCILKGRSNNLGRVNDAFGDEVSYSPFWASKPRRTDPFRGSCRRSRSRLRPHWSQSGAPERKAPCARSRCRSSDRRLRAYHLERLAGTQQSDAASWKNAFLDRRAGRVHGVIDAVLALLDLDLSGAADADHRDAASKLGQPLLQLLLVVIRCGLLDLHFDLS